MIIRFYSYIYFIRYHYLLCYDTGPGRALINQFSPGTILCQPQARTYSTFGLPITSFPFFQVFIGYMTGPSLNCELTARIIIAYGFLYLIMNRKFNTIIVYNSTNIKNTEQSPLISTH